MLRILSEGDFREASERILAILSKFVHVNTLFVAVNDGTINQIVKVYNRDEQLVTEGVHPYNETYCSHVCNHYNDILMIEDTTKDPLTADMQVTSNIGATTFIGIPITLKDGTRVGTLCGMSRDGFILTDAEIDILNGAAAFLAYAIELENAVYKDSITGSYTRRYVERVYETWLPEHPHITALVLNIGPVELFNKLEGYEVGEHMLRAVAKRIRDSVHSDDILARVSDTEFVVLTYRSTERESILNLGRAILNSFTSPLELENRKQFLSIHIGVASNAEGDSNHVEHLLKSATVALYSSILNGRHPIAFYYPEEAATIARRLEISNLLHSAIENLEFQIHYQPKFRIQEGVHISSTEALVRWRSHDGQWISPGEFIPIAEETGLIKPLGKFVLLEACKQNKAWQDVGYPPMIVSVNISPKQFEMGDMYEEIVGALHESRLSPQWLAIEITEGMLMKSSPAIAEDLKRIRDLGVKIAIDDYGKGHASLSYLLDFHPTHIKLDQVFIEKMLVDRNYGEIVSSTISLAQKIGMVVIAEGVETEEQLRTLQQLGCDMVQGFLLSRPLDASTLEAQFFMSTVIQH